MIVDSHLHIWRAMPNYPQPVATIVSPVSDVPLETLREYMAEHDVARAVLVQPVYPGEDNSYVADCAAAEPAKFAAVCVVDPRAPGAAGRLAYWVNERGCKGLRLRPRVLAERAIFGDPATYPLWEHARALGVVISLLIEQAQLPTLVQLVERFPEVNVVIDHMAHPDVTLGVHSPQFQTLLKLARFPRVYVKVTGYYYNSREAYPYRDCWPFFRALYDAYGPARLMWGSDFPHVLLKCDYRRTLLLQERAYTYLRSTDLAAIMGETAAKLYWAERAVKNS